MLHFNVVAVGGIKEKYISDAIAEYAKRISRWATVAITEVAEASMEKDITKKRRIEGESLIAKAKGYVILTDLGGAQLSSEEFAAKIGRITTGGISEITFIIGGSNGVDETVKQRADFMWSLGKITLPHQLFRAVLLEQIYRAETILNGVSYHK